ncbi:COP9 signalosome complex subunit 8 isoform X1 [Cannabis sativa]|uniref:COP9 signalosome complex subunit 8 isoform X1 n=1 Tax=Cannabis sativa TaxID=3483 RepID=UPI0029C9F596|nr:COP9 signalosome complex subunit 8 isoform X1 [Cannabis sativa]
MDFSTLSEALESKSYAKIADICDNLMLQVAAEGVPYQDEWPYAIHLLGHIYSDDTNSARFLWKSIPAAIKDNQPELLAAWKIGQKLWVRDYGGVHEAIRGFDWSQQVQGLVAAFSGKSLQNLILSIVLDTNSVNQELYLFGQTNYLFAYSLFEEIVTWCEYLTFDILSDFFFVVICLSCSVLDSGNFYWSHVYLFTLLIKLLKACLALFFFFLSLQIICIICSL